MSVVMGACSTNVMLLRLHGCRLHQAAQNTMQLPGRLWVASLPPTHQSIHHLGPLASQASLVKKGHPANKASLDSLDQQVLLELQVLMVRQASRVHQVQ
jgi:hypothetical protein